jgi:hypothetical protein
VIPARPTTYKGIAMRSRLEASWAALFDRFEWRWDYEPRCYADETGQYLPDFELTNALCRLRSTDYSSRIFVEVKPAYVDLDELANRMARIWSTHHDAVLALGVGQPEVDPYETNFGWALLPDRTVAPLFAQRCFAGCESWFLIDHHCNVECPGCFARYHVS